MNQLKVWAPRAAKVEVDLAGNRIAMQRGAGGWWQVEIPAGAPVDYAFVLDGGMPLPDPRSPSQPLGVHAPSRMVDHSSFRWTGRAWQPPPLSSAVLYELHVGTFTEAGTFDAVIDRIPHLKELGITHVELMPVAEFPGEWGWGYDGVDLYAPHHSYGGPDGLKRLVDALHANQLAVILDVVYNHLGPSGNYLGQYGPYFTQLLQTPWGDAVNLYGAGSDEVREFFIDNALMWLRDYHFDGLRLDAVHALLDLSAIHFLEQLGRRVKRLESELGRHLVVIAESDLNDPRLIRTTEAGGFGLAAQWSDDFHHALHTVLTGEGGGYYADFGALGQLAKALKQGFVYDGIYSKFRNRRHGRPLDGVPKNRLLAYLQNHDQVGNRAVGDRISALTSAERLKIGAALVLTSPFIPLLFQGEEWGATTPFQYFTNHSEPDLGRAVSEGRRREFAEFGWDPVQVPDPQDPAVFRRSKLKWQELQEPRHQDLLRWYRGLIQLRKTLPDLRSADASVSVDESTGFLRMDRGAVSVLCNLGREAVTVAPPDAQDLCLASGREVECCADHVTLPPDSVAILASRSENATGFMNGGSTSHAVNL